MGPLHVCQWTELWELVCVRYGSKGSPAGPGGGPGLPKPGMWLSWRHPSELSSCMQVQGIALKETKSLWCGGWFLAPYQLRGSSA